MLKPILQKLPPEIQKTLIERGLNRLVRSGALPHISKVILFGSGARSELTEISDLDFCVIVHEGTDVKLIKRMIAQAPREAGDEVVYDVLVFDGETFQSKSQMGGVCQIIAEEGLVIFSSQ